MTTNDQIADIIRRNHTPTDAWRSVRNEWSLPVSVTVPARPPSCLCSLFSKTKHLAHCSRSA
jgi:hypothetical protein